LSERPELWPTERPTPHFGLSQPSIEHGNHR
jgi:hypothetical protein